jgi:6-pyruvoyltetrahydropterin/6-carboxytetrahydropterin synthase
MTATVTRWIEFDAGHRVARHQSQCRHLHGHRYRLTVEVAGPILDDDSPAHGMVIDFGAIKDALVDIHDSWDHRFLLGIDDPLLSDLEHLPGVVVLDRQPTAENLATLAHARLTKHLAPLDVVRVTIDETAKCSATVTAP